MRKSFPDLSVDDIREFSVWRFTNESESEYEIEVVFDRPCLDLEGVIVGTQLCLADGTRKWALVQNISRVGPKMNDHLLTLTIEQDSVWFPLARYHDILFDEYSPKELASFLDKSVESVFPIQFDLREVLADDAPELTGLIREVPSVRLSHEELISLALK